MPLRGFRITNTPVAEWFGCISGGDQILGRGVTAEIRTPPKYAFVSREHARVTTDQAGRWLQDLNSRCGTWINGLRLTPGKPFRIFTGDRIQLGTLELVLEDSEGIEVVPNRGLTAPADNETIRLSENATTAGMFAQSMSGLTPAEKEVVLWASRGYTSPEDIGRQIHRSAHTIRTQMNSIFRKLGVHSRDELLGMLLRNSRELRIE